MSGVVGEKGKIVAFAYDLRNMPPLLIVCSISSMGFLNVRVEEEEMKKNIYPVCVYLFVGVEVDNGLKLIFDLEI